MQLQADALVLYKSQAARIAKLGERLEIELILSKETRKVRPKDVVFLHPGPVQGLEILPVTLEVLDEARELLVGEESNLSDLAELLFAENSPRAVWSTWQIVTEGLHFHGSPRLIQARDDADFREQQEKRSARQARKEKWHLFTERVERKEIIAEDEEFLEEVVRLALGQGTESRLLLHLKRAQNQENAHALLLELNYWPRHYNPYPARLIEHLDDKLKSAERIPSLSCDRVDLTSLKAYAIDDENSNDPDDAVSFDGERVWVHVADLAAWIDADDEVDLYARDRGATLYLPEGIRPMLPEVINQHFGLGLAETSPALSFAFKISDNGQPGELEIIPSQIRVQRLSYREADQEIEVIPALHTLKKICDAHRRRRLEAGAIEIELPECQIKALDYQQISITPMPRLTSRFLISEAMLMAGSVAAEYAAKAEIPMPYAGQTVDSSVELPTCEAAMVRMFAQRRAMRPGRMSTSPQEHEGLGLQSYIRVTSPLRRYLDLVAHQQFRRHLAGRELLTREELGLRIAAGGRAAGRVRQCERLSNRHWTLCYLAGKPDWQGRALVVDQWRNKVMLLIPELALEIEAAGKYHLGSELQLSQPKIDLPQMEVHFRIQQP